MKVRFLIVAASGLLLASCVGQVVKTVVTAPIKAAGAVVDATTTSQAEADRNRGREMRREEERQREMEERDREALEPDRL